MAGCRSDDRGTTLTEVLVVMAISALVVPSLYLAIVSGFRQERSQEADLLAETELQAVAALLTDDIRTSWSSEKIWSTPAQSLNLEYSNERDELVWIFWYLDGSSLIRVEMDPVTGRTLSKEEMARNLKVEDVFLYWNGEGRQIQENLASCAVRVTVDLRSVADDTDVTTTFDIAYRQRNLEVDPC